MAVQLRHDTSDHGPILNKSRNPEIFLRLLDGFELSFEGKVVVVPQHCQRVLAFLASRERMQLRRRVAGTLWPDTSEDRSRASLRTVLWRVKNLGVIHSHGQYLGIADHVTVDLRVLLAEADRLLDPDEGKLPLHLSHQRLRGDLLPEWEDDWLEVERERLRQLSMHALEQLSARLSALGRHGEAIEAAQAAVAAEPLRESAHAMLIKAHLAEGNVCEARRQFDTLRRLLVENLGQEPAQRLRDLALATPGRPHERNSWRHAPSTPAAVTR